MNCLHFPVFLRTRFDLIPVFLLLFVFRQRKRKTIWDAGLLSGVVLAILGGRR